MATISLWRQPVSVRAAHNGIQNDMIIDHSTENGQETERGRSQVAGFTVVPRWNLKPVRGIGKHEVRIPGDLVAALRRLANESGVPLSAVLLTAHAKVLGALSGEREVCTGYAIAARPPLPIRMTLGSRSWREVLRDIDRAESDLLAHSDISEHDLQHRRSADIPVRSNVGNSSGVSANGIAGLSSVAADRNVRAPVTYGPGLSERLFETVFDLSASGGEFRHDTVLWVGFVEEDGLVLRLRYRTEVLDAESAGRIAGYHLTVLS